MISKKILVQSAAAGLMAGAILSMPFFLYGPEYGASGPEPCPSSQSDIELSYGPYQQPAFRAAPPVNPKADAKMRRSIEERNRAAQEALGEINEVYEAEQAAAEAAHSFAVRTMAAQSATMVKNGAQSQFDSQWAASQIDTSTMSEGERAMLRQIMNQQAPMQPKH